MNEELKEFGEKYYYSFSKSTNKEEWIKEFLGADTMQYLSLKSFKSMADIASNCHPLQGLVCIKDMREDLIQNIKEGLIKKINGINEHERTV